jgi:hypothetical protein
MAKISRLSSEQRDDLTAYLDGELDDAAAREIEQVLSNSEVARHDVDMLSRTWDLLGVLPTVKASEEFSRKTLSMVRGAEKPSSLALSPAARRNVRRGVTLAVWGAGLAACGLVAFLATYRWMPNEADQLLDDFDILVRLDDYTEIGDGKFLKTLQSKGTFADEDAPEN